MLHVFRSELQTSFGNIYCKIGLRECYFLYLLLSAFLDVPGNGYCARVFVCLPDCDGLLCHTAATDEC